MSIRALTSPTARVAAVVMAVALTVVGGATAPRPEATASHPSARPEGGPSLLEQVGNEGRMVHVPASPAKRRALGVLSNGCGYNQRGIPACGTLLGAAYGANTNPIFWEQGMGHRLGVHRTYFTAYGVNDAVRQARVDLMRQRVPWISFKVPYSWGEMASGRGDTWARRLAHRMSLLDGPVWIAFHHEPEGEGDIHDWTAMQARLAPIVRRAAPNVAYSVILTGWNQFYGARHYSLSSVWPAETKIDLVGFDVYNTYGMVQDGVRVTQRTRFKHSYFARIERFALAHDVAWGLAETGHTDLSARVEPRFVQHLYRSVRRHGGVAMAYFNTTLNSAAPWRLTGVKERRFARVLRDTPTL